MQFKLFANCIVVKGAFHTIICDIQKGVYLTIPEALAIYFENDKTIDTESVKLDFQIDSHNIVDEYFNFLVDNDILFYSDNFNLFPPINYTWDYPFEISNAIIDVRELDPDLFYKTIDNLNRLHCKYLIIRCFEGLSNNEFEKMSTMLDAAFFHSVELYINYNNCDGDHEKFIEKTVTIIRAFVYSAPKDSTKGKLVFTSNTFDNIKQCGVVNSNFFSINIETFTESHHHNTCLNRKLSIDAEGNIRNCPSMPRSFGNIRDTTLEEALSHPDFKAYWHVKKDDITKCKDCEFRYICTDCRAYVDDPGDMYSAPLKCGYDPYTGVWEEWSTHPLKQEAIRYYGMSFLRDSAEN